MTIIYHMADKDDWRASEAVGVYDGTAMDKADGYIHFSTRKTVVESAAKHRAGEANLVLLQVEADSLGDQVKWEPARGGILFPHVYGGLNPAKVFRIDDLPLDDAGLHVFPEMA
ncbi:MAG: glutathione S-transferase [Sneathiella sp.]|nr:MAG: glutathione S-transferase [Sneathiella sp.]